VKFGLMVCLHCRSLGEVINIPDPVIKVPAFLIMSGRDFSLKFPGIEDLGKPEKVKDYIPNLEVAFIPEGTHFVQEQFPAQVNKLILDFFAKHNWCWSLVEGRTLLEGFHAQKTREIYPSFLINNEFSIQQINVRRLFPFWKNILTYFNSKLYIKLIIKIYKRGL